MLTMKFTYRRYSYFLYLIFLFLWFGYKPVFGALTPDRVLVVANRRSEISVALARYYLQVRHIPQENLVLLSLSPVEEIPRAVYVKRVERPLAAYLRHHGLEDRILAIVLFPGIPHKVMGRVARDGDAAAVDSELTLLYRKMLYGPYRLSGWLRNPFFAAPSEIPFEHDHFDIYLVTRIAAYTPAEAKALIQRALAAEKTRPPYTIVLDAKSGPTHPGDNWLYAAYLRLQKFPGLKLETSFDPAFLVTGKRVIGYASWGSNDPNYPPNRQLFFSFLPGAIGVTYVSTSARTFHEPPPGWEVSHWNKRWRFFAGSPQSLIADLIRLGITGISGNAYEPYLSASARPYLLFPAYLQGEPLAVAYYRALAYLSWQTVVVGDPLCRLGRPIPSKTTTVKDWFKLRKQAFERAKKRHSLKDRLFLAQIYLKQGLALKALTELKPFLQQQDAPTQVFNLLFIISEDQAASRRVERLLRKNADPRATLLLGFISLRKKRFETLKNLLIKLEANPQMKYSLEAIYLKALYLLRTGKPAQAVPLLEKLIAAQPSQGGLYIPLIKALKAAGEVKRASQIKNKLLSDPEFVELWPEIRKL